MFDEVLFPADGSDGASRAFEHVLDLAAAHDATVHVLTVADTTRDSVTRIQGTVVDALEREGDRIVREAADRAEERGVTTVTDVRQGEPYETIVDYAASHDVDLVAMATHGRRGLGRLLLGSTTERVLRRSDVPVLTIRPDDDVDPTYPYDDVLVPTDGSDCANRALATGVDVATAEGAALHLLSVVSVASLGADVRNDLLLAALEERADDLLDEAVAVARKAGVEEVSRSAEYGSSIHGTIRSYVEDHGVDLVVVGTHGRTGFDRYLLGSVTDALVRTSPVPVLAVRGPESDGG